MRIYGAGIAGLMAANAFPTAEIFEAGPEGQAQHKALLRFRSAEVGAAVGVDFKKVTVRKGVAVDGSIVHPSITLANEYANKVLGKIADRSIWNLDSVERFIAPEDFIQILAEKAGSRVHWNHTLTHEEIFDYDGKAISTLPLPLMTKFAEQNGFTLKINEESPKFQYAGIRVSRWRIKDCDVYQTIYFPDPNISLFRASITGDLLIAEYMFNKTYEEDAEQNREHFTEIKTAFGLRNYIEFEKLEKNNQRFGKIAPIDDIWRKHFIFELSQRFNIYSLGRFATWRNILLDDVLKDISVVKKLMNTSLYEHVKVNHK